MADTTITSANSILYLTVPLLFQSPTRIYGYATDKAFATEALELAVVEMGVDGRMTAGYTPNPVTQTISLQADSPSRSIFTTITQASKTAREIYYITGSLSLPSTGESFSMTRGVLTSTQQIPDAGKVLQSIDYVITWESVNASLL